MIIDYNYSSKEELIEFILSSNPEDLNWYMLSKRNLPEDIIIKYKKYINFGSIISWQKLSEQTIISVLDMFSYANWIDLCFAQSLSEEFIQKYKHKLYMGAIWEKQKLSINFIMDNFGDIIWDRIMLNKHISDEVKNYIRMFI